jgi:hypothetical protein
MLVECRVVSEYKVGKSGEERGGRTGEADGGADVDRLAAVDLAEGDGDERPDGESLPKRAGAVSIYETYMYDEGKVGGDARG